MGSLAVLLCVLLTAKAFSIADGWSWDTGSTTMDPFAASCWNSCDYDFGSCSCSSSCQYFGNCCHDINNYCPSTAVTTDITTASYSCRYNCGNNFGSCSCRDDCFYYGSCCYDYDSYCSTTTHETETASPSCRYNCGYHLGSCSCRDDCRNYGNCCYDYDSYCSMATTEPATASPTCRYNCGYHLGSCSCRDDCRNYGNCCYDYDSYCSMATTESATASPTCRYNCGYHLGSCSCRDDCRNYGNCCYDYDSYCSMATTEPATASPTCRYNCGYHLGSCSCSYDCRYRGNCCYDYDSYCSMATTESATASPTCRYNCGYHLGSCSCRDDCRNYGNCCYDYDSYCSMATTEPATASPTCRYNCGYHLGSCSCRDDCRNYGNCCYDYDSYCSMATREPATASPTCRYNCGYHLGSCSCSYDCRYRGNCCYDYDSYCSMATTESATENRPECGGHLYGSGMFSSPKYPRNYFDNAYCVWYLSAQSGQRIFLSFADVQLERCCGCDYISVHDGASVSHRELGRVCFNDTTHQAFHSSSRFLTVLFRSDSSGVNHGFKALFTSSLTENQGRVDCASDNMVIVFQTSYLNSLGFNGNDLYVDDHRCRPNISSSEVVFRFSLDTCGTGKEMMNGYVTYTNNVRASQSQSGEITRQSQFLLRVGCRMEPDTIVQIFYHARESISANITGTGRFNASIAFYTSSSFQQQIYDSPYEVNLNQDMYAQVMLDRNDNTLDLFLDTCVTSPDPYDFKTRSYDLLRNGCPRDSTYFSYTSGQFDYARFGFKGFKFLRTHAFVYLQCKVIICPDNDANSRCRRGCQSRRRRSIETNHHTSTVILGPIKLRGEKPLLQPSDRNETAQ